LAGLLLYQGYGLTIQSGLMPLKYFSLSLFFSFALQTIYELLDGPANHIRSIFEGQFDLLPGDQLSSRWVRQWLSQ